MTTGVLHPGQMGSAIAAAVVAGGTEVLWCGAGRSRATATRAADAGLRPVPTLDSLLSASEVVLSVCPPASAEEIAMEVAARGFDGIYVEANAISVARSTRVASLFEGTGTRVVDAAIIGPPPTGGKSARLYLAGPEGDVSAVSDLFAGGPVDIVALGSAVGDASALKMAFAGYQKAARTLAAVAHALAARHGLTDELVTEARKSATPPLADPGYLPSVAARAWRWAPEMLEVADTLGVEGLPTELATATATTLGRWRGDRDDWTLGVEETLSRLLDESAGGSPTSEPPADPPGEA